MEKPATIQVVEQFFGRVPATAAKLLVSVSGERLFTGRAALKEAVEVRKLIDEVREHGVAEKDVGLESLSVDVSKGLITKSSSAKYLLGIWCQDISQIPAMLDVISKQKNCKLSHIEWDYDGHEATKQEWLKTCVERARAKATAMCAGLGVSLGPVYQVSTEPLGDKKLDADNYYGAPGAVLSCESSDLEVRRRATVADTLSGTELAPNKDMGVRVTISFKISAEVSK
ncbi:MAG: hypothetical protein A2289_20805 [Deltaproteobacteria bacterium RIFOXYA12_FULL_58_15]|nr:MAG: hypothetical protein A2289_20805 [Deltaproteobacteria bacterium RIFOXYA12_FULL_58_15]OGR11781.1 MAG: hypothetical protein A2341_02540 [Deltaproteobacteria bacterium RIFOXYB12_FULL_58_9]